MSSRRLRRATLAGALAAMIAAPAAGCSSGEDRGTAETAGRTLRIAGSDTMRILAERWGEAFSETSPGVEVSVEGGGSGRGIAALLNGATDLANASRPMREREKVLLIQGQSKTAREVPVALDALAVFVHPDNPVRALSIAQLRGIYTGEITRWDEVGGTDRAIEVYNRDEASGTYAYFQDHVLEGASYTESARVIAETATIIEAVEGDPGGIGYGGIAYVEKGVNALAVSAADGGEPVPPTPEAAVSGRYPLSRILYVYGAGPPGDLVGAYLDFVRSEAGERIVEEVGYYPLPEALPDAAGDDAPEAADAPAAAAEGEAPPSGEGDVAPAPGAGG